MGQQQDARCCWRPSLPCAASILFAGLRMAYLSRSGLLLLLLMRSWWVFETIMLLSRHNKLMSATHESPQRCPAADDANPALT